jgi:hypothetical protein
VVREDDDAHTVWTKINGLFTDNKLQRIVFLQQDFFGTSQNHQTLDAYYLSLKAISDELHDLGFKIGDEILLSTLTAGLNEDLGDAASNLTLMTDPTCEEITDSSKIYSFACEGSHIDYLLTCILKQTNIITMVKYQLTGDYSLPGNTERGLQFALSQTSSRSLYKQTEDKIKHTKEITDVIPLSSDLTHRTKS